MDTRPPPADLVVARRRPRQSLLAPRTWRRPCEDRAASFAAPHPPPISVDELCARWRGALDAAAAALRAAHDLPVGELTRRRTRLDGERTSTLQLLRALAKERGASTRFLQLAPRADVRRLLGVPAGIEACVFNLDGVLMKG